MALTVVFFCALFIGCSGVRRTSSGLSPGHRVELGARVDPQDGERRVREPGTLDRIATPDPPDPPATDLITAPPPPLSQATDDLSASVVGPPSALPEEDHLIQPEPGEASVLPPDERRWNVLAIIAFAVAVVISTVAIVLQSTTLVLAAGIAGFVLSLLALSRIKATGERGGGFALAALIASSLLLFMVLMAMLAFGAPSG